METDKKKIEKSVLILFPKICVYLSLNTLFRISLLFRVISRISRANIFKIMTKKSQNIYQKISPFDEESDDLNVIIETPKDCRNKYALDEELGVFVLKGILTAGHFFPYDFGFIPQTLGGDGDPLDVLVLMDEPAFVGCLVKTRLIGVIEAEQTEQDGKVERNDRLIGVAAESHTHKDIKSRVYGSRSDLERVSL